MTMEKLDIVWKILEIIGLVGAGIAGGWIFTLITIKSKVKQEQAETKKREEEAKTQQIDNIRKTMEEVYRPIIEDLQKACADARADADRACERVNELEEKVDALERENRQLKRENEALKEKVHKIDTEVNGTKPADPAPETTYRRRDASGRFVKKVEGDYDKAEKP